MTPLTTSQTLTYALIPGLSEDFEEIAYDQRVVVALEKRGVVQIQPLSPLSQARTHLVISSLILALGIFATLTTFNPKLVMPMIGAVMGVLVAGYMLFDAAMKVQTAWNNQLQA